MSPIANDRNSFNCAKMPLVFFVNGKKVIELNPDPECTLLTYLREKLRLCGTKLGCGEGGCGACTVMVSRITDRTHKIIKHYAVNACLTPVCAVHGQAVTTVEGIGSTRTKLHPVQERIAKAHGSQCGFCTPGIVMSMYALLRNMPTPTMKDMEVAFQGNLCRCTGYRPIIEGYRTFTQEFACGLGEKCCKVNGNNNECGKEHENESIDEELFDRNSFLPYDPSQEPIFPPELVVSDILDSHSIVFHGEKTTWFRPTTLDELLAIKSHYPEAKIIVGNTEVGVETKFKYFRYPILALPMQVHELIDILITDSGVRFGAAVTLTDMDDTLKGLIDKLPEHETRVFKSVTNMLHYFAGKQIRNVASIGGNIMTGSPISDLIPIFTAAGIELEVSSLARGTRRIRMDEGFFIGYRKSIIESDEILISVTIPKTHFDQYFLAYKQAKRRDDDIAIVNMALNVTFQTRKDVIVNIHIAFGGMAPTVVMAPQTCQQLIGKKWNRKIIEQIGQTLIDELPLSPSAPGGMIQYRRSLTLSLFFKGFLDISQSLETYVKGRKPIPDKERSGADVFHTLIPSSCQIYEKLADSGLVGNAVGQTKVHASAFKQATGEAVYCDDMPKLDDELYLALVLSTRAHAKLISIDATEALQQPGVHAFFSAKDLTTHQNQVGPVFHDEEVFISDMTTSHGQAIGAIVADNQKIAQAAARLVKVSYEDISPIIVTIEDAILHKSFFTGFPKKIQNGDIEKAFAEADHIVEGEFRMGGQEHFYLETHAAIAIPRDTDELEMYCSTQHPTELQHLAAHVIGIPASRIVTKVKRIGGGFGGKETRGILVALPVALAAYRLGRPVRLMLDRDEDMAITGTRHPFYFKYKAAATNEGKITGCDIEIYNNGGYSYDLSTSVLERAMFHFENAYRIPNVRVQGWVCRTNIPSNTAFRGFGGPQGMFAGEHIIRDVAKVVNKTDVEICEMNLYQDGDRTHYNQELVNCNVKRCWTECLNQSNYHERKQEIEAFNKQHRWRKRGIAMVPTKFGIAFTALFLNQTGALIHVYTDGSVLLSHGGVEMGQGLHTKMIQVASSALQIPCECIHIAETATDKVPNTSATAASAGSDLNGMAVLNACNIIMERLEPYRKQYPSDGWNAWITKAYFDRVSLSAAGFYRTPDIGYDFATNSGNPFNYFTFGAACSEVEIDCLTGDHQVIRTDIIMDLGESINPAIDIGQVEGAFMQGYGLLTLEEMIYSPNGLVMSRGPGVYKLPGFADIPGELNVSLLKGSSNPRAVYSSKAVGEPPLFLASSVFFAIKEAIADARHEENLNGKFALLAPATAARIRVACHDKIMSKLDEPEPGSYTPWNVMP